MVRDWMRTLKLGMAAVTALALAASAQAGPLLASLKPGSVNLQSAGPITFGAEGVLFVGDPKAATIYAIGTGDTEASKVTPVTVDGLSGKLAGALGVKAADIQINDLAVNPVSNRVYLSVSRGKGPDATPVLFVVGATGELKEVSLSNVPNAKAELSKPVAAGAKRQEAITGLKVVKDALLVAGLSNEEFASTLRSIPLPFSGKSASAGIQIYHGAHGKYETAAPVRTFTSVEINGKEEILAAYTCTPLVRIPVSELTNGAKVNGTTIAELGNRNRPLDIVVYENSGHKYALMANSARGVMKVSLDNLDKIESIVAKVADTAGTKYETLKELNGVEQLAKLGEAHAVLLVRSKDSVSIKTINLP
jgi:hypothetical protein